MKISEDEYMMPEDFSFDGKCLIGPDKEGGTAKVTITRVVVPALPVPLETQVGTML